MHLRVLVRALDGQAAVGMRLFSWRCGSVIAFIVGVVDGLVRWSAGRCRLLFGQVLLGFSVPRVRLLWVWTKAGEGGALADVGCFLGRCCWHECVAGATGNEWGMVLSHDARLRGCACVMLHCISGIRSRLMQSLFGVGLLLCPSFGLIHCLLLLMLLAKYLFGFNCESIQNGVASVGIARRAACGRMLVI